MYLGTLKYCAKRINKYDATNCQDQKSILPSITVHPWKNGYEHQGRHHSKLINQDRYFIHIKRVHQKTAQKPINYKNKLLHRSGLTKNKYRLFHMDVPFIIIIVNMENLNDKIYLSSYYLKYQLLGT